MRDFDRRTRWLVAAALLVASVLVYAGTIDGGFPLDDRVQVERNVYIRNLGDASGIFTRATWPGYVYRPLPTFTYALTHAVVGLDPWLYHVTSILLHAVVAVLVFFCLRRVFDDRVAAIGALFFAVHPVHVEAIASIANRTELLVAVLALSALLIVLPPAEGRTRTRRALVARIALGALLYFAALLAKENTLVFFLLLPLVLLTRRDGAGDVAERWRRLPGEAWPGTLALALATAGYFAVRSRALTTIFVAAPIAPIDNWLVEAPALERILHAFALLGRYVAILLIPRGLSADYSYGTTGVTEDLTSPDSLLYAALATAAVAMTLVGLFRPSKACLFFGGWFLAAFAVTSNVVFPIGVVFADRLAYLPSIAMCALLAFLLVQVTDAGVRRATVAGVALTFAVLTVSYGEVWRDNRSLFRYELKSSPGSAWVHHGLAVELLESGAPEEARQHFLQALRIYPGHMAAAHGIALVELSEGNEPGARRWLARALDINPKFTPSLVALGSLELQNGRVDDAGRLFVRALNVDNRDLDARVGVLAATLRRGNLAQATAMRDQLMALDPSRADLRALSHDLDRQLEALRASSPAAARGIPS